MTLAELLNTFLLITLLLILIWALSFILQKLASGVANRFLLALSVFIIISGVLLLLPLWVSYIDSPSTGYNVQIVLACFWWFALSFLVNQAVTFFIWNKLLPQRGVVVSKLIRDLVALAIMIVTVAAVVHFVFNRSVVGIFAASGIMAIVLGYSAQAILGDVFAGIGLNLAKQFSEGDLIKVLGIPGATETLGIVKDINWRFVNFLTLEGNNLSIPNSTVAKQPINNYSRPYPTRGIKIVIPLPSNISPEAVKRILVSSALQSFKVSNYTPPKAILLQAMEPNNTYQLTYFTKEPDETLVSDEILSIIWYQIKRKGIKGDDKEEKEHPVELIERFLEQTDLFTFLNSDEINLLAKNAVLNEYGPPERILEQGQKNDSLFLLMSGRVDAFISTPTQKNVKVGSIQKGQYFGEMSLLTGDPCTATIVVSSESSILTINHETMAQVFETRPELMEKMSEVVVLRKMQNVKVQESMEKGAKKEQKNMISRLAQRVRSFFKKQDTNPK